MAPPVARIIHPEPTLFSRLVAGAVPKGAAFYAFTGDNAPRLGVSSVAELRRFNERALKEALIHDMAALLNARRLEDSYEAWRRGQQSRRTPPAFTERWPLVARSVLNYGVADIAATCSAETRMSDRKSRLHEALLNFEPRLASDSLSVVPDKFQEEGATVLHFSIVGDITAALADMPVRIDTLIDASANDVRLKDAEP